jgi:hypothetical protein
LFKGPVWCIIEKSIEEFDMKFPKPTVDLAGFTRRDHAAVQEQLQITRS